MPNVARVNGFKAVKYANGAMYNGQANLYFIPSSDATAVAIGDVVKLTGAADSQGVPAVTRMSNGSTDVAIGVVVGLGIDPTNLNTPQFRVASTNRYVLVADDPNIVYEANCAGTAAYNADPGLNVGVSLGAGVSTTTGNSSMQADLATKATTSTLPFRIVGFVQRADMDYADTSNAKVLVAFNTHSARASVTGV